MKLYILLVILLCSSIAFAQPWQPELFWERDGLDPNSHYGRWILPLGDQNDDGFSDWALCAPADPSGSEGGGGRPGRVDFFHGGLTPPTDPFFVWYTDLDSGDYFVANECGDINGDGLMDVLRTDYYLDFVGQRDRLYLGGIGFDAPAAADWWFPSWRDIAKGIGDLNGDDFDDLAYHSYSGDFLLVYYGGSEVDTLFDWSFHSPDDEPYLCFPWTHGDLNGDGFEDFVSNSISASISFIFLGGIPPDTIPDFTISNFRYGEIVNDINGDGADELVGLWGSQIQVYFGGETIHQVPDALLNFPYPGTGLTYGSLGDINDDGFGDFGVAAESNPNLGDGFTAVYLGHPWINPQPQITIPGGAAPYKLIGFRCIVGLQDASGDGIADFGIGAFSGFGEPRGRAVVIAGDTFIVSAEDKPVFIPTRLDVAVYPNPFNSVATVEISVPPTSAKTELVLYNVLGQIVMQDEPMNSGQVRYQLQGDNLSAGLYVLSVRAGQLKTSTKVMLLK